MKNAGTKICGKCGVEKALSEFSFVNKKKGTLKSWCRECDSQYYQDNKELFLDRRHKRYENNKEAVLEQNRNYYHDNREERLEHNQQYRDDNRDHVNQVSREYYHNNRDYLRQYQDQYREDNKEIILEQQRQRENKRRKEDASYKLRKDVSSIVRRELKKNGSTKRGDSVANHIDFDAIESHIEKQFSAPENLTPDGKIWMTWDNWKPYDISAWVDGDYSTYTWNLDHIIPQSCLPPTSMEDENFKICWMPENCRPLPAKQNIREGNRITPERKALILQILGKLPPDTRKRLIKELFGN